jgi:hypothetical protein
MLTDTDATARPEWGEIVGNLAKIAGLPAILLSVRSSLEGEDKASREIAVRSLPLAALSLGLSPILLDAISPLLPDEDTRVVRHSCGRACTVRWCGTGGSSPATVGGPRS